MTANIAWLRDVISLTPEARSTNFSTLEVIETPSSEMCLACRGGKMLCGKLRCPIMAKAEALARYGALIDTDHFDGASPPSVFVGRIGYPQVYIGPMIPPYHGNTQILDMPELWVGRTIDEIIDFRFSLVRGKIRADVHDPVDGTRILDQLQELALAARPTDSEIEFTKKPRKILSLSEESQPFGPSAPLKRFKSGSIAADHRLEKAYYDGDLKAADAVMQLYSKGVFVSTIQRALSIGMLGTSSKRKLVPTRWSITAVDSTISLNLINEIKYFPTIDDHRVYYFEYLDNRYVAIFTPENWAFEWIEAWFPHTMWNMSGISPALMGDYEPFQGRTTYASVGGCYYSARLAAAEMLRTEERQAKVLLLREIHPGYILPVGVWNVRESIRRTLAQEPSRFADLGSALAYAMSKLSIPYEHWVANSVMLKDALFQRRMTDFLTSCS